MFEFKVIEEIKPNTEMLEIIKNCTFTIKNGKVKAARRKYQTTDIF